MHTCMHAYVRLGYGSMRCHTCMNAHPAGARAAGCPGLDAPPAALPARCSCGTALTRAPAASAACRLQPRLSFPQAPAVRAVHAILPTAAGCLMTWYTGACPTQHLQKKDAGIHQALWQWCCCCLCRLMPGAAVRQTTCLLCKWAVCNTVVVVRFCLPWLQHRHIKGSHRKGVAQGWAGLKQAARGDV